MALDSGGHFVDLAAAQALSQAKRVPGIIGEDVRRGALTDMLPVSQQSGTQMEWVREKIVSSGRRAAVGSTLIWDEENDHDTITESLVIGYKQTLLNNYVQGVYGTFNNYATVQAMADRKALMNFINEDIMYGDPVNGAAGSGTGGEVRGLHHLANLYPTALGGDTNGLNIDEGEAGLSLKNMRDMEDRMRHGIDFWMFPFPIWNRLSAYTQEAGLTTNTFGQISFTENDLGKRVYFWNGTPIVPTDYLVAEQENTGVDTTTKRLQAADNTAAGAAYTGDNQYSIFAVKRGLAALGEPGLSWNFGGEGASAGEPIMTDGFDKMENSAAKGLRQTIYHNIADGSRMALGRIYDIEDVAIVA